jgi:diguanylate cyclase (GGDEF)-like protein
VIVAIDEKSLARLGRWPWSRRVHAQLLEQLTRQGVRAVGFDILMIEAETDDAEADQKLAQAMAQNQRTVLAIAPEQGAGGRLIAESLPLPVLAQAAAALGHVDLELDVDGLCRRVYLYAGMEGPHWRSFGLALADTAYPQRHFALLGERDPYAGLANKPGHWLREQCILIPFAGPNGHFERVSYVDVLDGRAPDAQLSNRIVLVGATAAGLGDALATPASRTRERMPGVEMNANITRTILEGRAIRELSRNTLYVFTVLVVFFTVLVLSWPVRRGLLVVLSAALAVFFSSYLLLIEWRLWLPPATAVAALLASYPLWSLLQHNAESRDLQRLRKRIEHHTKHHPITGLPNQEALQEYLQGVIQSGAGQSDRLGLLVIQLEQCGAQGGDLGLSGSQHLLKAMADKLRNGLREADFVAHLSDDEFAIVMDDLPDIRALDRASERIHGVFQYALDSGGHAFYFSPRIGVSLYPADSEDAASLIDNALTAMHKARDDHSESPCFFTLEIRNELRSRSLLEEQLRHALQRGELQLYYQPQVVTQQGSVIGAEALLRWRNPLLGKVPPEVFIPIAERMGLILPIGEWVLEQACRQARDWEEKGLGAIRMAVNLSPLQFAQDNLLEAVLGILQRTGLAPSRLELEVTEGALMQDFEAAIKVLGALKQYGVTIAIDDFGTGYSSLSYLKRFPLDRLKIDRSFITEIGQSGETGAITQSIIAMAHRLNLQVIAEGVENECQVAFLQLHACDEIQGFLYGRPLLPSEFEQHVLHLERLRET